MNRLRPRTKSELNPLLAAIEMPFFTNGKNLKHSPMESSFKDSVKLVRDRKNRRRKALKIGVGFENMYDTSLDKPFENFV